MSKFRSIATKDGFTGFVPMSEDEASKGLSRLSDTIARTFGSASVTYANGMVLVQLRNVDAVNDTSLSDRVMDAVVDAFPQLALEPLQLYDETLGELTWEEESDGFEGNVDLDENEVDIVLCVPPEPTPSTVVERARDIVRRWAEWWLAMQQVVVNEFLSLYNDEWHTSDAAGSGESLTRDEFLKRLSPASLRFDADLGFRVRFLADGMFTEHDIIVSVSADDLIDAALE